MDGRQWQPQSRLGQLVPLDPSTLRMELTGTVHPPATLSDLVLEDADDNTIALTPTFDTETTSYTASVGKGH